MNEEVTKEATQTEPSKTMKVAKIATTVAVNVATAVLIGVVTEQVTKQVNKKFFPDQNS